MKGKRLKIAVTGAAGQISYSLLFRLASGEVFGPHTTVDLNLLELPQFVRSLEGVALELDDCGYDTLGSVNCYDSPNEGFDAVNWALLLGSQPRKKGMERADLIRANGPIFVEQGRALSRAAKDLLVVVVGNPCNTNALIALHNCPDVPAQRFTAMMSLDQNRARGLLAKKAKVTVDKVSNLFVWGNHSPTMYVDFENSFVAGESALQAFNGDGWLKSEFLTKVQQRGAQIIDYRGKSSAASAASACIDHIRNFAALNGPVTFSAAVTTDGSFYGLPGGASLFSSFAILWLRPISGG